MPGYQLQNQMLKDYYTLQKIAQICKELENREIIFMNKKGLIYRNIVAKQPIFLKKNMDHYNFFKNEFNIYQSIAVYSKLPIFSWNIKKRKEQYAQWTGNKDYLKFITEYEFYMDFDNKGDFELTKQECIAVSEFLHNKKITHHIRFSGSGFHIKTQFKKSEGTPIKAMDTAELLKKKFMLETVDMSIYRWQGIIKAPWSVDCKTMNVCLPLKLDELRLFKPKMAHISKFMK